MSKRVAITGFSGGMTNNTHTANLSRSRISVQYDILSEPNKLIPMPSVEADGSIGDTEKITQFTIVNGVMYGLGVVSGSGKVKIFQKSSFPDGAWSASTTGEDSAGTRNNKVFVPYKSKLYGWTDSSRVWSYDTSTNTFTGSDAGALSYTNVCQGLVHSKDDVLYMPYDNKIAKKDNTTWTTVALTLPDNLIITSISEYGNYLAIATKSKTGTLNSKVYLWDRDSSLSTISDVIDFGSGDVQFIEQYEGRIVGASIVNSSSVTNFPMVVFKEWYEGLPGARDIQELEGTISTNTVIVGKQRVNGRVYFMLQITINGTLLEGVWSIGRPEEGAGLAVSLETQVNNGTSLVNGNLFGFYVYGDYVWLSFDDNGSYVNRRTNNDSAYSATSKYQTTVNPDMPKGDRSLEKQLMAVAASYVPLPANGSVVVKYRVDGGAWTTVFTESTDSAVYTERSKTDAGDEFTKGRNYEFDIQSTGGADVVELSYVYQPLTSLLNP